MRAQGTQGEVGALRVGNLIIRRWVNEDWEALLEAVSEPSDTLARWLPRWTRPSEASVREWIAGTDIWWCLAESYVWSVWNQAGDLLGEINVHTLDWKNQTAQLGYWVRTSRSGHGVATAAVRRVAQWAFEVLDLQRLEIQVAPDNVASLRCAVKIGAVMEPTVKGQAAVVFSLRRADAYSL